MEFDIGHDYPMSGNILYFEAYMFATTARQMAKQASFDDFHIYETDGSQRIHRMSVTDQNERKSLVDSYNDMLHHHGKSALKDGSVIPSFIVYMTPDGSDDMDSFNEAWGMLVDTLDAWTSVTGRCAAMTAHYHQVKDGQLQLPHVHILYEKQTGVRDELQQFLMKKLFGSVPESW